MAEAIWIASFPRSGNTFLRLLLRHCLGLRSGSIYANDLGESQSLKDLIGHVEHDPPGTLRFQPGEPKLVKTHDLCKDDRKAIYIVRDGRAAAVSLWRFFHGKYSLRDVVTGKTEFGLWQDHVESWDPVNRPNTLFLRHEEVNANPLATVDALADFLGKPIISREIPARESVALIDGKWITPASNWREVMTVDLLEQFNQLNGRQLAALGYAPATAVHPGHDAASAARCEMPV